MNQKLRIESENSNSSRNNQSSNLEDLLKELRYEKAIYETEKKQRILF